MLLVQHHGIELQGGGGEEGVGATEVRCKEEMKEGQRKEFTL